jgi:hypothetical protein
VEEITMQEINDKVLKDVRLEVTEVSFNTWIKKPVISAYLNEHNNIIMKVENDFIYAVLKERYINLLENLYKEYLDFNTIEVIIEAKEEIKSVDTIFTIKPAKELREIAKKSREKLIDVKKEAEKALIDINKTIEIMATKGEFKTSYLIDNSYNDDIINIVINELKDKGYITEVLNFSSGRKTISISWE